MISQAQAQCGFSLQIAMTIVCCDLTELADQDLKDFFSR